MTSLVAVTSRTVTSQGWDCYINHSHPNFCSYISSVLSSIKHSVSSFVVSLQTGVNKSTPGDTTSDQRSDVTNTTPKSVPGPRCAGRFAACIFFLLKPTPPQAWGGLNSIAKTLVASVPTLEGGGAFVRTPYVVYYVFFSFHLNLSRFQRLHA